MAQQVSYYNNFSQQFGASILGCPEPHLWTTDYEQKGRVYKEIRERVEHQKHLALTYLDKDETILDIGCGFGRQAYLLTREGFKLHGLDTSNEFVLLATKLFQQHQLDGRFECIDITTNQITSKFSQALLFDVLEHIPPKKRNTFANNVGESLTAGAILIISLPRVKNRFTSQLNNRIIRGLLQRFDAYVNSREHPYPIPGRKQLIKMFVNFQLIHSSAITETDFYVLRKN